MTMRHMAWTLAAGALLLLLLVPGAFAQVFPAALASGVNAYNPHTVQTLTGRIEHVWTAEPVPGLGPYQMISIRLPNNTVTNVAVAPPAFVRQRGIPLQRNDAVSVTGSLVVSRGQPVLLASRLREGPLFTLRDAAGHPLWLSAAAGPVCGAPTFSSLGGAQTISGKIEHVWTATPAASLGRRQLISVRLPDNTVRTVVLAPPAFVRQIGIPLRIGDSVTVTGSPVALAGHTMLVANQLQEGGLFTFRRVNGSPLWGAGETHPYNRATQQTVSGKIEHVWVASPAPGLGATQMISVRRPDKTVMTVALAPPSFIDRSIVPLTIGDPATVTGSLVIANGQPVLLARELREGGMYALCDAAGNRLWS